MSKFWKDYSELGEELICVKNIIKKNIKGSDIYFKDSIEPLVEQGGKMLRPAFLLLGGKFGEYDAEKLQNLAGVVEMLHLATLIHDDIIDDSKLRRGCESIQSKYGKDFAVYAGDYLFSQSFNMLSKYEYTTENMKNISKVITKICMGEIRQHYFRYTSKVDFKKYIRIISGKTAALFALSFILGAKESNCEDGLVKILGRIGYNIGMAFQIIDDLLDYTGNADKVGKSVQNDLKQGYYTLPVIFAMKEDKKGELAYILDNSSFNKEDIEKIIELVKKYNGIENSKKLVQRYTVRAFKNVERLPECESKQILKEVIEKLIHRKY
ncbi:polyprenyl synthetase family protein [Haloimpatiens sp. FM7330]|uniref:polyprenyl synthetase family protein n=1 Tax=Haloimpatiens sp. FM7330 TaxID=3298610 RepID=UPI00362C602C